MEKLRFNSGENKWILQGSSDPVYPEQIQKHHTWLEMFQAGDFFYFFVTEGSGSLSAFSDGIRKVLGYEPDEVDFDLLLNSIHPDDLPVMEEFEAEAEKFYLSLPAEERWNYKTQYNLRIKTKTGRFKHVMFQSQPYGMSEVQEAVHLIAFTDISSIKTNSDQYLSLIHIHGGPSKKLYRKRKKIEKLPNFSKRELEILKAVMTETDLHVVAQRLHISEITLSNQLHRIRKKAGAKSTVHLMALAEEKRWLRV